MKSCLESQIIWNLQQRFQRFRISYVVLFRDGLLGHAADPPPTSQLVPDRGVSNEAWISCIMWLNLAESFESLLEYFRFIPNISHIVEEN